MSKGRIYHALEALELFLYRRAAAVVVLTASFREDLIRRGIDPGKIAVVINGVDLSRYQKRGKDQELIQALSELLLSATSAPAAAEGGNDEPQADR